MQNSRSFFLEPFNLLIFATLLSLVFANTSLNEYYNNILSLKFGISLHFSNFHIPIKKSLLLWVNEGFMAIFFFSVILEIKHDFTYGSLNSPRKFMLPLSAAIGGMIVPAAVFLSFNYSHPINFDGWAIPVATDIAFSLGLLLLFKDAVHPAIRVLLLSIAVIDDLGSIIIIAIYYTDQINSSMIMASGLFISLLMIANMIGVRVNLVYYCISILLWYCLVKSGIHATLSGVLCGLFMPLGQKAEDRNIMKVQSSIYPFVYQILLPSFAFLNAGVRFIDIGFDNLFDPIICGIVAGLVVGKPLGIFLFSWLAIISGIAKMPANINYSNILAIAMICGIGFTMSLFFGTLAFDEIDGVHSHYVRIGVLLGSTVSAILGYFLLRWSLRERIYD
jgi:Na+:H+ antiporter, NhaA family